MAREQREAQYVAARIKEVYESPVQGNFDIDHLKVIHSYLFQDFPEYKPGIVRDDTRDGWIKMRLLEGQSAGYHVHYAHENIEGRISDTLNAFGGPNTLKGLAHEGKANRMAKLYGDLDHMHGFHEGNSRTLREFTRMLAAAAGHALDWTGTGVGANERNMLYVARDVAVLERAFPGLTPESAMLTEDRAEYEASFVLTALEGRKPGPSGPG